MMELAGTGKIVSLWTPVRLLSGTVQVRPGISWYHGGHLEERARGAILNPVCSSRADPSLSFPQGPANFTANR